MEWISIIMIVVGLIVFETISSIDNAIINAEVVSTMKPKARRWFLTWGIVFAVVVVRGLLPWLIVYFMNPSLGFLGSFTTTFSNDPSVKSAIDRSAPILMTGGGIFLVFLFLHWIFLEDKHFGLIGSTAFFITHGFKQNAEHAEKVLLDNSSNMSDISKILYLEVIDTTFSIDGVLGAFAFTFSVPLILIGNGIGAIVVRQLTVGNIDRIKKYVFLKNGAMYSILVLGAVMMMHGFGIHVPEWVSPLATVSIILYFFWKSKVHLKMLAGDLEKI